MSIHNRRQQAKARKRRTRRYMSPGEAFVKDLEEKIGRQKEIINKKMPGYLKELSEL